MLVVEIREASVSCVSMCSEHAAFDKALCVSPSNKQRPMFRGPCCVIVMADNRLTVGSLFATKMNPLCVRHKWKRKE